MYIYIYILLIMLLRIYLFSKAFIICIMLYSAFVMCCTGS